MKADSMAVLYEQNIKDRDGDVRKKRDLWER